VWSGAVRDNGSVGGQFAEMLVHFISGDSYGAGQLLRCLSPGDGITCVDEYDACPAIEHLFRFACAYRRWLHCSSPITLMHWRDDVRKISWTRTFSPRLRAAAPDSFGSPRCVRSRLDPYTVDVRMRRVLDTGCPKKDSVSEAVSRPTTRPSDATQTFQNAPIPFILKSRVRPRDLS
jgi:hypothetical protein